MKKEISTIRFSDPELEAEIKAFDNEQMEIAQTKGMQDGKSKLQHDESYYKVRIANPVQMAVADMITYVQKKLNPLSAAEQKIRVEQRLKTETENFEVGIKNGEVNITRCTVELRAIDPNFTKILCATVVLIVAIITGVFDGIISYESIRSAGMGLWQSLAYSGFLFLAIAFGHHILAEFVTRAKRYWVMVLRLIGGFLLAAILFYFIGDIRYEANVPIDLHDAGELVKYTGGGLSGLSIGLISWIAFVACTFSALLFRLTPAEQKVKRAYRQKKQELEQLKIEQRQRMQNFTRITDECNMEIQLLTQKCELALSLKRDVENIGKNAKACYAEAYIQFRNDGKVPPYFTNGEDTNFQTIK